MARIILFPYKIGSASCKALQVALQQTHNGKVLRVRPSGRYRCRIDDVVINWGNSKSPEWTVKATAITLNKTSAVAIAANKLRTLQKLEEAGVSHVEFTTDRNVALGWLQNDDIVVARRILNGHSGAGIEIVEPEGDIPVGWPLYTKFIARTREYRVHVFKGEIIDYAKKVKRVDDERGARIVSRVADDMVRSHELGWEYLRDVEHREDVVQIAKDAVEALGLDFGAVDIIRDRHGNNYILEVGTAAGLSPAGVQAYTRAIMGLIH